MTPKKSRRSYSDRTLKILWGRAAGRCALPHCRIDLFADATAHDPIVVIGDIAHVEASSGDGPRANNRLSPAKRDEYENLILLCKNCHTRLDGQKRTNTVALIKQLRANHEAWVRASLPERGRATRGWRVLMLEGEHPIDAERVIEALEPDFAADKVMRLQVDSPANRWPMPAPALQQEIARVLKVEDPITARFAVFPLAPVSACLALGYMLTNRSRIRLFQHHRSRQSWSWIEPEEPETATVRHFSRASRREGPVALFFNLSATVASADIERLGLDPVGMVRIGIQRPSISWLSSESQLDALGQTTREVFDEIERRFPNATELHVFFAGPAPAGAVVGQQISPTMSVPVIAYEYRRSADPPHVAAVRFSNHEIQPLGLLGGPAERELLGGELQALDHGPKVA